MRVYGSSPLYNYVELIFRSRKLFIVSIILATVVTVSVATMKASTYNARALILLSGEASKSNLGADDPSTRGSIAYKMSVLNIVLKDPGFIKTAFTEAGLNKKPDGSIMTDEEFKKYCQEAHDALNPQVGGNIMELSCHWKDKQCVDIINTFYDAYSRRVLQQETVVSTAQTQLIKNLNDEYTDKVKTLEKSLIAYRQKNSTHPIIDYTQAVNSLQNAKDAQVAYESHKSELQQELAQKQSALATTPKMQTVTIHTGQNQQIVALEAAITQAKLDLTQLLSSYTDNDRRVRQKREQIAQYEHDRDALKKTAVNPRTGTDEELNPTWITLNNRCQELEGEIKRYGQAVENAKQGIQRSQNLTRVIPEEQYEYKWKADKLELYESIRKNLSARQEQAQMDEQKDRDQHIAEMQMMVPPEAELDVTGSKTAIFFLAGPILGFIIAFAFSLLAETLDHSLRTPLEVEKYLGKPVLAVLPRMDTAKDKKGQARLGAAGTASLPPPS